jgi:hypothetical protein
MMVTVAVIVVVNTEIVAVIEAVITEIVDSPKKFRSTASMSTASLSGAPIQ